MAKKRLYYIQNGYSGNALCWWREGGAGYTADLNKAGRYTEEQARIICQRPDDHAWPCEYIDSCLEARVTVIDYQYVGRANIKVWRENRKKP